MPAGVAFSLAAYLLYSCCDAIIKGFGSSLSVFEIAFWTALFSFLPAIFTKPKGEHWRLSDDLEAMMEERRAAYRSAGQPNTEAKRKPHNLPCYTRN